MPLDTDQPGTTGTGSRPQMWSSAGRAHARRQIVEGLVVARSSVRSALRPARTALTPWLAPAWKNVKAWSQRQPAWRWLVLPAWRWCVSSLGKRILTANSFGLLVLFTGLGVLTFQHTWLIDARTESLRTQGRMIAVAIASNAKLRTDGIVIDPDRPIDSSGAIAQFRDDTLSRLSFEIAPEQVAPVLRRLIQKDDIRVRIYTRDNRLLVDSYAGRGATETSPSDTEDNTAVQLRSLWTKFVALVNGTDIQVYRELNSVKAPSYPEAKRALTGELGNMMLINDKGEQIIAVTAPIERASTIPGFVLLTTKPGALESILWRERRPFFVLSLIAILATALASWLLTRTIGGPMRQLSRAAEHVSRNINARSELPEMPNRTDEIGMMARNFAAMTAGLYRRIEASDHFAQDVAHELKNPVAAARSTAESLGYAKTPEKRDELVQQIQSELKRLNRLISDVANASRLDAELALQETEPVDIARVTTNIAGVFRDIQSGHDGDGCRIDVSISPQPASNTTFIVDGHEGRLGQVITNLLDNALSFSPPEGAVVTLSVHAEPKEIVITIDDQGPGIPQDKLEDVFKRFYSDRPQTDNKRGKNSGLGLSISREIIEAHAGKIRAENIRAKPGEVVGAHDIPELAERRIPGIAGVRFEVRLPRFRRTSY